MKTKEEVTALIKNQLAIEYNCVSQDFSASENIITLSKNSIGKRHFIDGTFFFQMATFGDNTVITADACMHAWLREYTKDKTGYRLFEHNHLVAIDEQLKHYNQKLWSTQHMFLPYKRVKPHGMGITIKWFEQDELYPFYELKQFSNALSKKPNPKRPDVLAVAGYDGHTIIGMAGCSADTPLLWQIGIDVNPKYRGKGIGAYLVALLKYKAEQRDKVPYYGTSLSNLHSWNIALHCGFYPAWIEIMTEHREEQLW